VSVVGQSDAFTNTTGNLTLIILGHMQKMRTWPSLQTFATSTSSCWCKIAIFTNSTSSLKTIILEHAKKMKDVASVGNIGHLGDSDEYYRKFKTITSKHSEAMHATICSEARGILETLGLN
jgi:hypothetical protein